MAVRSSKVLSHLLTCVFVILAGCGKKDDSTQTVLEKSQGTWLQSCHGTSEAGSYVKQEVTISGDAMSFVQTFATDADCASRTLVNKINYSVTLGASLSQPSGAVELNAKTTKLIVTPYHSAMTSFLNSAQYCTASGAWVTEEERDITSCGGVGDASQYTLISLDDSKTPNELWLGDCDQSGKDCSVPEKRPTQNQGANFLKQ